LPNSTPKIVFISVRSFTYQQQRFTYHLEKVSFGNAVRRCIDTDSGLLIINSAQIQSIVNRHLRDEIGVLPPETWENAIAPGYWVGGFDISEEGNWQWIDGSSIPNRSDSSGFENWYDREGYSEPNGRTPQEDCMYISGRVDEGNLPNSLGAWFDDVCYARKYFICQSSVQPQG